MKKILLLMLLLPSFAFGQTIVRPITIGGGGLSSNQVYDIIVANAGAVTGGFVRTNETTAVIVSNILNVLGGSLNAANGSVGSPSLRFANDADTGLYSAGSGGEFSVSINGVQTWIFGNGAGGRMFRPSADNTYDIGEAAKRVANIFTAQVTSDAYLGNGSGLSNVLNSAISQTSSVLSPSSNQTNYTITLYPNGYKYFIYTASTNVNITFSGVTAGNGASVFINAITSSVSATVTTPSSILTNLNYVNVVTNGQGSWYNYESIDGTSTNITALTGGAHRR